MITAMHSLIYADDPDAARSFFADVLGFPHVDAGDGWLIFKLPPGELGFHPLREAGEPPSGTTRLHFMCDDVAATVEELKAKGVEILGGIEDHGYGLVTTVKVPGGVEMDLYQPTHEIAYDLGD